MIVLYTTHCPKCEVLKKKLDSFNIAYEICEDKSIMIEMGMTTIPMLSVDDKLMDFGESVNWLNSKIN